MSNNKKGQREEIMKIIKRDGHMVDYCPEKIEQAITKANRDVVEEERASAVQIKNIIGAVDRQIYPLFRSRFFILYRENIGLFAVFC